MWRVGEHEQELTADDPPRVRVIFQNDGDRLDVLVDADVGREVTAPD